MRCFSPRAGRGLLLAFLAILAGCAPTVLTQSIPVSSNPAGATVRADDGQTCQTPCQVNLTRNADHVLVLTRDGYRQQDVVVRRVYQSERVMARAVNEGISSNDFFKSGAMGVNAGIQSLDEQEQTGEAYLLSPSAVSVNMVPLAGHSSAAPAALPGLDASDLAWIGRSLESLATGQNQSWTNQATGASYVIFPGPASQANGAWVRPFTLRTSSGARHEDIQASATRQAANQWRVDGLTPAGQGGGNVVTAQPPQMDAGAALGGAAVGAASAVSVPVVTGKDSSSHSHTSVSQDGSTTTTKTSSSSVKGSVSVNPVGAAQALEELLGGQTPAGQ